MVMLTENHSCTAANDEMITIDTVVDANPLASRRVNDVIGAISTKDQKDAGTRLSDDTLCPAVLGTVCCRHIWLSRRRTGRVSFTA